MHGKGQIPLRYPVADQVADLNADLRVRVVCVSCACRRPVESWLKASCEPVEIARTCLRSAFDPKKVASWSQTRTNLSETWSETGFATRFATSRLDIVMEFGANCTVLLRPCR